MAAAIGRFIGRRVATPPPSDQTTLADDGMVKSVLTAVNRSNGIGREHITRYSYHGPGFESTRHRVYLGFYATREIDAVSCMVTFR